MMSSMNEKLGQYYRLLAYWMITFSAAWIMTYYYVWIPVKQSQKYSQKSQMLLSAFNKIESVQDWASNLLGFISPMLLCSCVSALLVTSKTLPSWRLSWINKCFACVRSGYDWSRSFIRSYIFRDADYAAALYDKKNQYGIGEPNFNLIALWFIGIPAIITLFAYLPQCFEAAANNAAEKGKTVQQLTIEYISYTFGWVGVTVLAFFLIPVSRHSILLAAVNWSPIHALRIHIWAGFISFTYFTLHGVLLVFVWFMYNEGPIWREFIPSKYCFSTYDRKIDRESKCLTQLYNFTGIIAWILLTVLWATSLQWFRRKYYRLFYMFHVIFGSLSLIAFIWHMAYIGVYILPSLCYYLASTMPTLIQALASRFRGGVAIIKVIAINDSSNCIEIHVPTSGRSQASLNDYHCSKYIKLCMPEISLVWHPFTVYTHVNDPSTLRILFRPIGPFTKKLRTLLVESPTYPLALVDGFYRGGDHVQEALRHDHVSIIAGGVAITPFISMLNTLIAALVRSKAAADNVNDEEMHKLKSLTIIWSCREVGLLSFVKQNYIEPMSKMATSIEGFVFKVKIFHTGTLPLDTSEDNSMLGQIKQEELEHTEEKPYEEIRTKIVSKEASSNGHYMELGHLMPGQSPHVLGNLPFFLLYTTIIWVGFHQMFFNFGWDKINTFARISEQAWYTLLLILFYLIIGILIEVTMLLYRKHMSARSFTGDYSQTESFDCLAVSSNTKHEHYGTSIVDENDTGSVSIPIEQRRPNADDYFEDALSSTAPGIFLDGPIGMVDMVKRRARKEHSIFDLETVDCLNISSRNKHESYGAAMVYENDTDLVSLPVEQRRPDTDDCFDDAILSSTAPGIFLCGPIGLVDMVKQRAREENSIFCLTRYAIYEESFEM